MQVLFLKGIISFIKSLRTMLNTDTHPGEQAARRVQVSPAGPSGRRTQTSAQSAPPLAQA